MTDPQPAWRGPVISQEPPAHIRRVRDSGGAVADRLGPCDECNGSLWRWRHNGGTDCWLEIDGIGPWGGWES